MEEVTKYVPSPVVPRYGIVIIPFALKRVSESHRLNAALKRCSTHEKLFQAKRIVERINGSGRELQRKITDAVPK